MCVAIALLSSCEETFLEGYEDDPSRPLEVSEDVLLTSAQTYTYFVYGDEIQRTSSVLMQQMQGADRQFLALNRYVINATDYQPTWNNAYAGGLKDLDLLIEVSEEKGAAHYAGVAKVLTAMNLGVLTDVFGAIPFSEGLSGAENLTPSYDSGEEIYTHILSLLDDAVTDFNSESTIAVGSDDMIYGGDLGKWTKLAYALKARYLNHLSETDKYDADAVLAALAKGFESNEDNAVGRFQSSRRQANLWYQFLEADRPGYIIQEGYLYDLMEEKDDPRLSLYRSEDAQSIPSLGSATSPLLMATYMEAKFIEAEAQARKGNEGNAQAALEEAVTASIELIENISVSQGVLGEDETGAAEDYIESLSLEGNIESIMEQKYIAMFTQSETWTDWRRTGYPNIDAFPGNQTSDRIPRRLPYPQSETLYNPQNTPDLDFPENLLQPIWWDK